MPSPLIKNPAGFDFGFTPITAIGEPLDSQMNFGILKLKAGEHYNVGSHLEWALLLLTGHLNIAFNNTVTTVERYNFFEQAPIALHLAPHHTAKLSAQKDCELAIISTDNDNQFDSMIFDEKNMLENEHRGQGLLNDTAYRIVRTIFDKRNRPQANLVLGEVINFAGRWSSYPPHHHIQPEIYHYRFSKPQGYGHAELGEDVFKVKHYDTIKILDEKDHAQVSAPGYGMFYIWAIRHLLGNPYDVPTFTKEHAWTLGKSL